MCAKDETVRVEDLDFSLKRMPEKGKIDFVILYDEATSVQDGDGWLMLWSWEETEEEVDAC